MKIILEDNDLIFFEQHTELVNPETLAYKRDFICNVLENFDGQCGNRVIKDMPAETFWGNVIGIEKAQVRRDLCEFIATESNFEFFGEGSIDIKIKKVGDKTSFKIGDKYYSAEELKEAAKEYEESTGIQNSI